ncbi:unnamed protein product [Penicillium nalgiovense]|uniref:Uncharacterized protein n=3 Tax=Penicillium TaxID=5073 RepID=A0A9W4IC20_9EURO|nr:unnamed protein product [Penicillium salamii]CAG7952851.1 unnamed protein product [Penicillium nalgiovense]CRL31229.1 Alcohol dehydrogenase superfamily, zinc-containing [Penicillium camemberti]CAG7937772.1 unnamed protein product [Penicillium salamii]CAG7937786.1 unnamed protein product [Penicillium salamii]
MEEISRAFSDVEWSPIFSIENGLFSAAIDINRKQHVLQDRRLALKRIARESEAYEIGTQCHRNVLGIHKSMKWFVLLGYGGDMSQKILAPSRPFLPIPGNVSLELAAFIEPLALAWHAVKISPFKPGDSVLILGSGPIGLGVVQVLKLHGAKNVHGI